MMGTTTPSPDKPDSTPSDKPDGTPSADKPAIAGIEAVGGPVWVAWREGTLTRAEELEALCAWVRPKGEAKNDKDQGKNHEPLVEAIQHHLAAARQAARAEKQGAQKWYRMFRNGPLIERAMSNIDAAEAHLLNLAPDDYILGQMPCLLRHVQCHLLPTDPRRQEFERIARKLGIKDPDHPLVQNPNTQSLDDKKTTVFERIARKFGIKDPDRPIVQNPNNQSLDDKKSTVKEERRKIVTIMRAASSAALRENVRLRSFRNVVVVTGILMALLAIGVAVTGYLRPTLIPLCFAPEDAGVATVVCPTGQSEPFIPLQSGTTLPPGVPIRDIDKVVEDTVEPQDLIVVELVGLTAAAVATAAAVRGLKGSSERYGLPVALAALKLPTGAITAFLGLLLMRGQFVPGLTALDTSAQILAWALVFGYAQQLFTRFVDQQGQTVLENVRGADRPQPSPTPP
jgi:hypothetical protein